MKKYLVLVVLAALLHLAATGAAMPDSELPLVNAVANDNLAQAKTLLKNGAPVNRIDAAGIAAIHVVRSVAMLDLLVQYGADVDIRDGNQRTAMMLIKSKEVLLKLIDLGADLNARRTDGDDVLNNLLDKPWMNVALIQTMVSLGLDLQAGDSGNYALAFCAYQNYQKIAKYLLEQGANPNLRLWADKTAWETAAEMGFDGMMTILKPYMNKENLTVSIQFDQEMVSQVMINGNQSKLEALLDKGLDVNALIYDKSLLYCVCEGAYYPKMVKMLIARGADVNWRNPKNGFTPLMAAFYQPGDSIPETARLLVQAGAEVNPRDDQGKTLEQMLQGDPLLAEWKKLKSPK